MRASQPRRERAATPPRAQDDDEALEGDESISKVLAKQGKKKRKVRLEDEEWDPDAGDDDRFDFDFTEEEKRAMRERKSTAAKAKSKKKWSEGGEDDSWVPGDD